MMVLDEKSAKIISSHFKLSELLEKNILSIEKLELNRKPFPKMQAIYFLSPDSEII
jgi:syntaxin-binding protein 1